MTDQWIARLSEVLDGELSDPDRESFEAHLATCAECARTLEELRAVTVEARRLEDRAPEVDLWPGIAARLRPRRAARITSLLERIRSGSPRFELSVPQLAAAGLLLVVLSGGGVWLAMRGTAPRSTPALATRVTPERAPSGVTSSGPRLFPHVSSGSSAAYADFDEARYDAAVADLERALRDHGSELDTATVRVLEQNLAIIDRAIDQARRALEADPANPYLNDHLAEQLMQKVRLLQRATEVVAAHG
jgi:hypothetical protein